MGDTTLQMIDRLPVDTTDSGIIHAKRTLDIERVDKILYPRDNQYVSTGNNVIRIDLPSENADYRQAALKFNAVLTTTGGTYKRIAQGAFSIFSKIRLVIGDVDECVENYNLLTSLQTLTTMDPDVSDTIGFNFMGLGTQAQRNAKGATVSGTEYTLPVRFPFLMQGIFPGKKLINPQISQLGFMEFTLTSQASTCIETDGTDPIITINNIEYYYEVVTGVTPWFDNKISEMIASGNLKIGYNNWTMYQKNVPNSTNDLFIPWKGSSLNSMATILIDDSTRTVTTVNDKFMTYLKTVGVGSTVQDFQYQLNNELLPPTPVRCNDDAQRAFLLYLKWQGLWDGDGYMKFPSPIDLDDFNLDTFLMVGDFHAIPRDVWSRMVHESVINNVATSNNNMNTILKLNLTASPPASIVAYTAISYNTVVAVQSNGRIYRYT